MTAQAIAMKHHATPQALPHVMELVPYKAGKSKASGHESVIKLSSNESNLGPSPHAWDAIKKTMAQLHRYPDGSHEELREAIGAVHKLPADQIVCGNGSDELIALIIQAYCGEGDNIVYSQHGFLMYKIYAQACGVEALAAKEDHLRANVDAMLATVNERTKVVFLANPNNPTGSYISAAEITRLREGLRSDILLVVDAAYAEYVEEKDYSNGEALVKASDNTVMLRTFSKIYALPALRLGWMFAPENVVDVINRVRSPFNVNQLALAAGMAAVEDQAHIDEARAFNNQCLNELPPRLEAMGITVHPSVCNFLLLEFPDTPGKTATDANAFLTGQGIILREVAAYGLPNCLRMTIGLGVENDAVLDALDAFMKQ